MARRKSLHIGLNYVDPDQYGGWDGELAGCINDANDMKQVAESRGFTAERLIDGEATIGAVRTKLDEAAAELEDGDFYFLTYSGHGGQVPDQSGDEPDGYDETCRACMTPNSSTTPSTAHSAPSRRACGSS